MNPPEIDLFFARPEELEVDPDVEYLMVEDRGGLFEANRHTLVALQRMMREPFPLSEHLVQAKVQVPTPAYVQKQPRRNVTSVLKPNVHESFEDIDIIRNWPTQPSSDLDASQLKALRRMLTKQLAIVQGPPGTGKTFVSVQAVKIMLENWREGDPPILVACQTNHAIDQFLRHISQFEPEFLRLGGRSKDRDIVKKRTLFAVRALTSENAPAGSVYGRANRRIYDMRKEIAVLLAPLQDDRKPLDVKVLTNFKILTVKQSESLISGASKWVQAAKSHVSASPFTVWLGDKLVAVPPKQQPEEHGFEFEELDLEFERLKEEEAEGAQDEDFLDSLAGSRYSIADNFTCRKVPGITSNDVRELLNKHQDMWKIPEAARCAVYRYLQSELKKCITAAIRDKAKAYDHQARERRIGQLELDEPILKRQKVIGMTTTGLSKYRGILSALQPKVVLIEEAAETLEAPVTVGCMPSLQQLILVGDHQQLRPHTHVSTHQDEPWFLNVSLFERMVNNGVEYSSLNKQRRMIPEIRRLLYPIYQDMIKDHPSVNDPDNRPNVPGMGGVNSFFFTHQWAESRDDMMSCYNDEEAKMIVGFVEYLVYNGMQANDITILTFYNGQRKKLLSDIRSRLSLEEHRFNVVTVDSYQGEENKVVILSLTRSNDNNQIGFLSVDNRVCVALSRAQCGSYIFGNGMLLYNTEKLYGKDKSKKKKRDPETGQKLQRKAKNKTWSQVIEIMAGRKNEAEVPKVQPNRLHEEFPIRCKAHNNLFTVKSPEDWYKIIGGCEVKCNGKLPCGHPCPLTCHPFPHDDVFNCADCRNKVKDSSDADYTLAVKNVSTAQQSRRAREESSSGSSSWNSFAVAAQKRHKNAIDSYIPSSLDHTVDKLVDIGNTSATNGSATTVQEGRKKPLLGLEGATESNGSSDARDGGGRFRWKDKLVVQAKPEKEDWSSSGTSLLD